MRYRTQVLRGVVAASLAGAIGCGGGGGGGSSGKATVSAPAPTAAAQNGTFTTVGALATGRRGHTATWLPGFQKVLVAGGIGRSGSNDVVLDSAELFDPLTLRFTPAPARLFGAGTVGQNGRAYHAAVALPNGRVLMIGGQTDLAGQAPLASLEVLDPSGASATVAVNGSLSEAKAEPIAFSYTAPSGAFEVAIAGGRSMSGAVAQPLASVNFYQSDSNSVVASGQLPAAVVGARALPIALPVATSTISPVLTPWMIAGGVTTISGAQNGQPLFGYTIYEPATRSFQSVPGQPTQLATGQLVRDRAGFDAAVLGGQVTLLGGRDQLNESSPAIDAIESFDVTTGAWTGAAAHLATPRQGHTATLLPSGEVLVVGGVAPNGQVLGNAELITAAGGSFLVTPIYASLGTPRRNHTATPIRIVVGGQLVDAVLIAGGVDASGQPVASAEVFAPALQGGSVAGSINVGVGSGVYPSISSLFPNSGPVGTLVTIQGLNFSSNLAQNVVRFNGILAPVQTAGSGQLTAVVPQGAQTGVVTVKVDGLESNGMPFTLSTTIQGGTGVPTTGSGGGQTFNGPPTILVCLPASGGAYMPVGIGGFNFDKGAVPYFNGVPSIELFNFTVQSVPLVGSVSVGLTIVPAGISAGNGNVSVFYNGRTSNIFPFSYN